MDKISSLMQTVATRSKEISKDFLSNVQPIPAAMAVLGVGACLLALRFTWKTVYGRIHKHPPELYGLPIVGSLFTVLFYKENFFVKFLPRYGDIVKYNIGTLTLYTIQDAQLMTKILQKAADRPKLLQGNYLKYGYEPSVVLCNEEQDWSFRRKTIMRNLNILMNSTKVDKLISDLCQKITFKELDSIKNGQLWYPEKHTSNISFNITFLAIFGRTLDVNDARFIEYNENISFINDSVFTVQIFDLFPTFIALKMFGDLKNSYGRAMGRLIEMAKEDLNETFKGNENSNNNNSNNNNDNEETLAQYIWNDYMKQDNNKMDEVTKRRIISDLHILTIAGLDTTGLSLHVCILLLAKYPEIQEIVYNELYNVMHMMDGNTVGGNGDSDSDAISFESSKFSQCPHFRAFIHEGLRITTPGPHLLPHTCDKDLRCIKYKNGKIICDFKDSKTWNNNNNNNNKNNGDIEYDYIIKANSIIDPNAAYATQYNTKIWNLDDNAMTLNLNYWLKKDEQSGKLIFKHNNNSVPFSVGSRQCLGISLAMKEMAAFMANLILNYKITAQNNDPSNVDIKYETIGGGIVTIKSPIGVLVSKRH